MQKVFVVIEALQVMDKIIMNIKRVVNGGYCIGCGACAVDPNNHIAISLDSHGKYQASLVPQNSEKADSKGLFVCPFSDESENEDQIGTRLFNEAQHDPRLGYYRALYIGYVAEGAFREKSTSGGLITWLLTELLETKAIDGVIHVTKSDRDLDGCLFEYSISRSRDEILAGAKSRYYPVEASQALRYVREHPGRYAFVGVPCFVKAVRNLMAQDAVIAERIKYCIGIVCGHLKSRAFADCFAWQAGIAPGTLEEIDFRVKRDEGTAGDYSVWLKGAGIEVTRPTRSFLGSNWGYNFFRYEACDYCDDVFAETADIAVGDAWLPPYSQDPKGTSVVVVRNAALAELVQGAITDGRLNFDEASVEQIALSQAGGLRDRREGLAYRLYLRKKQGVWAPKKRVSVRKSGVRVQRRKIYKNRSQMGRLSHVFWLQAVRQQSFEVFEKQMDRLIKQNNRLYHSFISRCFRCAKQLIKQAFGEKGVKALKKDFGK
jgi:coenzyme F420-reducing hydrogenase beta subunit